MNLLYTYIHYGTFNWIRKRKLYTAILMTMYVPIYIYKLDAYT